MRRSPTDRDQGDIGVFRLQLMVECESALHPELDLGVNMAFTRQPTAQDDNGHLAHAPCSVAQMDFNREKREACVNPVTSITGPGINLGSRFGDLLG